MFEPRQHGPRGRLTGACRHGHTRCEPPVGTHGTWSGSIEPRLRGAAEALARELVPPGSTETGAQGSASSFTIYLDYPLIVGDLEARRQDLEAFWDAKIPSLGLTFTKRKIAVLDYEIFSAPGIYAAVIGIKVNGSLDPPVLQLQIRGEAH